MNKYKEIAGSPTFHLILIIAILQILKIRNVLDGAQAEQIITVVQQFFAGVAGVRVVTKIGTAPSGTTTVTLPQNVSTVTASTTEKADEVTATPPVKYSKTSTTSKKK